MFWFFWILLNIKVITCRECLYDSDCIQTQQFGRIQTIELCYSNKCVPSPHPCRPTPCGDWAGCYPARRTGRAICFCPPGFLGDNPLEGCRPEPLNPCSPSPCGKNSTCTPGTGQRLTCGCIEGYIPNQEKAGCVKGCDVDAECKPGLMCVEYTCVPRPCRPSPCGCGGCRGQKSPWVFLVQHEQKLKLLEEEDVMDNIIMTHQNVLDDNLLDEDSNEIQDELEDKVDEEEPNELEGHKEDLENDNDKLIN